MDKRKEVYQRGIGIGYAEKVKECHNCQIQQNHFGAFSGNGDMALAQNDQ